jgi:uncharacterized lipoprotein
MRKILIGAAACLLLAACGKADKQADALDQAASQSDPAAAAELHNQADVIRDSGDSSNVADAESPAQNALQAAGNAAAADPTLRSQPEGKPIDRQTGLTR